MHSGNPVSCTWCVLVQEYSRTGQVAKIILVKWVQFSKGAIGDYSVRGVQLCLLLFHHEFMTYGTLLRKKLVIQVTSKLQAGNARSCLRKWVHAATFLTVEA